MGKRVCMKLSELAKRMIITILIIAGICVLGSVIYYRSFAFLPFLLGAIIGSGVSISKVFLLEHTVDKAITMEKDNAVKYITLQNILRLLLSGIALVICAVIPQISLWGAAAGILAFPFSSYGENIRSKKEQRKEGE